MQTQDDTTTPSSEPVPIAQAVPARDPANDASYPTATPRCDIFEDELAYSVEAEVPGVHLEDLELHFEDDTLTLAGTRHLRAATPEREGLGVVYRRRLRFAKAIDPAKVQAELRGGVLLVRVHKAESARPRKISIAVG